MSDSDQGKREWRFFVTDMMVFAEKVISYTTGMDQAGFVADERSYDATLRNLELIGEAAGHIPEKVRKAHNEVPWRLIIATRNRLIHAYLGVDNDIIWSIIQDDIPPLLSNLRTIQQSPLK